MSKVAIGEYYDNKYGQRFVITGFAKDYNSLQLCINFYDVDTFDVWGDKWSMPIDEFRQYVTEGKLTYVAQ